MTTTRGEMIDPAARRESDYDAIADLFLGDSEPIERRSEQPAEVRGKQPGAELLIAGHLPVLGGAWVVQYASRLARACGGPIALAQVGAERTAIQVLWAGEPAQRPDVTTDLRGAVHAVRRTGARWLIATDELTMLGVLGDARVASACLLTAPNEAATVAAYQTLKSVSSELARTDRAEELALRVAFAGASPEDGERALSRIDRAAGVFMRRRIELAATVARIAPTIATPVYESAHRVDVTGLLDLIDEPVAGAPVAAAARRPAATHREPAGGAPFRDMATETGDARPRERQEARGSCSLASHLHDEDLQPTSMRCPDAPAVEVAVGGDGLIHLLREAGGGSVDAAVRELWVAMGWLERQSSLVNMALRRDASAAIRTRVHLFVGSARGARALLDAPVRVYLLRTEVAQGRSFTFCEALN